MDVLSCKKLFASVNSIAWKISVARFIKMSEFCTDTEQQSQSKTVTCSTLNINRSTHVEQQRNANRSKSQYNFNSDVSIEDLHRYACERGDLTYIDPPTGYTVLTQLAHVKRGKCCGNACRHCPFDHCNVKSKRKEKPLKNSDLPHISPSHE